VADPPIPDIVRSLRHQAARLRRAADAISREADLLVDSLAPENATLLRGRAIPEKLRELLSPGDVLHYTEMVELLKMAGYIPSGIDPPATLLANIARSTHFEPAHSRRSGCYRVLP
jgi:hypothetical protein